NWYQIFVGQGYTASEAFAPLRHLWSLAVEEQFYLLWPLIMVAILYRGRKHLPKVALWLFGVGLFIAAAVAALYSPGDIATSCAPGQMHGYWTIAGRCININEALYLGTFSRAGGLMLGAAFAMIWRPMAIMRGPIRRRAHRLDLLAVVGLAGLGLSMWKLRLSSDGVNFGIRYDPWLFRGGFLLTGLCTLLVIAAVTHQRAWAGKVLGNPVMNWVGTRSYGLYLFHWPIYQIIRRSGFDMTVTQFVIAMVITIPITELSYRLIESPIRRNGLMAWRTEARRPAAAVFQRRRRLIAAIAATSAMLGFAGVSLAVANNVCVGAVECSLEVPDGGATVATVAPIATSATTAVPDTTAVTDTATATTSTRTSTQTSTQTSTETPIDASTDASDGASPPIGADAAAEITVAQAVQPVATTIATTATTTPPAPVRAPLALGESVMLGAVSQLQAGGFYVDAMKSRQGTQMAELVELYRANDQIGDTVVIQIGTNGSVGEDTFSRIMAQMPPETTPMVVFLTVTAPRKWTTGNNEIIRSLPFRYPNVSVLDWEAESRSIGLCEDGFHLVCGTGAEQFYANLIFQATGRPELRR
ncbi:MAG: acyltransferase family protein, partial [Ilumatobacteraceae bacterium]